MARGLIPASGKGEHVVRDDELVPWLEDHADRLSLARSLALAFHTNGYLSRTQTDAARNLRRAVEGRRPVEKVEVGLDLSSIPAGVYAIPGGDTRLRVRIDKPTEGTYAGWIFVKDGSEYGQERKYGKQRPGGKYVGDIIDALRVILADPRAASAEYGRITSKCGLCGRTLEDVDSVARGIGPHCAKKAGW